MYLLWETKTTKQETKNEFDDLSQHIPKYLKSDHLFLLLRDFNAKTDNARLINGGLQISRNGALLRNVIKHFNQEILNNKTSEEKWKRIHKHESPEEVRNEFLKYGGE